MNRRIGFADSIEDSNEQFDLVLGRSGGPTAKKRKKKKLESGPRSWYYLGFLGEVGFSISLPIAGGALLGAYLDSIWGTYPKATLTLLLTGIGIAIVTFVKVIESITRKQ